MQSEEMRQQMGEQMCRGSCHTVIAHMESLVVTVDLGTTVAAYLEEG